MRSATATAVAWSTGPPDHGLTGTPLCSASRLAATLSPSSRIASADGPRNTSPWASHASGSSGRSAAKPHPGHSASAPAALARCTT